MLTLTLALGCTPDGWRTPPTLTAPEEDSGVALTRALTLRADRPCQLEVDLVAPDHRRELRPPGVSRDHALPLVGVRADHTYEVEVRCIDEARTRTWTGTWATSALPDLFPTLSVFAHDPAAMEPGYTLFDVSSAGEIDYVVVVDADLEVVWFQRKRPPHFLSVLLDEDGLLFGNVFPSLLQIDWLGVEQRRWDPDLVGYALHHEAQRLPDGRILSLTTRDQPVPALPVDEATPDVLAPGTVVDDGVIVMRDDGTVDAVHWLTDVLDPSRIGFDALTPTRDGRGAVDWSHANAVVQDPSDGGFLVTLRHQDALVKLTTEGDLDWILGTPSGWQAPWDQALLTPEGPITWPFHPHAAEIAPDGTIWVFDNGNHRVTPYDDGPPPDPPWSQVSGFRVDGRARTVTQVAAYRHTEVGELYAPAMGDADWLPQTGHVLGVFGRTRTVDGVDNGSLGRGDAVAHLIEFDPDAPDAPPAMHLALSSPRRTRPEGWTVYRAERVPSLYAWARP